MEPSYTINREDRPGYMLKGLGIGSQNHYCFPDQWTTASWKAIHFNKEEALVTIEFITNVIDEYLGEQLYIEQVK